MNSSLRKRFCLLSLCTILATFLLLAIYELRPTDRAAYREQLYHQMLTTSSLSDYMNKFFQYEVTQDSVTTAYHLRHPEDYGIPSLSATLSSFNANNYQQLAKEPTSFIDNLTTHLDTLIAQTQSSSEQLSSTLLNKHLNLTRSLNQYPYYEYLFGASTGIQTNLPITLCEYPLPDPASIETYLQLLEQVPDHMQEVIRYDQQRHAQGIPTPAFLTAASTEQLATFLASLTSDTNCFTETFHNRLMEISSLSADVRSDYESHHQTIIHESVLPAYQHLYEYLIKSANTTSSSTAQIASDSNTNSSTTETSSDSTTQLSTTETSSDSTTKPVTSLIDPSITYGLASLPDGKDYYSLLVQQATGSDRPISELIDMTDHALQNALGTVLNIALTDQTAYLYYCDHPLETYYDSPEAILEALSLMIRKDYPALSKTPRYTVKQVPDSLATSLSPAFYMIPAIDDYDNNTIYVNPLYTNEDNGNLFTTLAHEGFPGHLYQTVYFNASKPSPIRQILDYPGYVEGWATYVEMNIFPYLEYPLEGDNLCQLYQCDTIINLALCSRIDLGVNYEGWTLEDTRHFFKEQGFHDYYAENVYSYVVEAPSNYLSYFIGYLEIEDIKSAYRNLRMEQYSDQDFHKHFLDLGPADFATIRQYLLPK